PITGIPGPDAALDRITAGIAGKRPFRIAVFVATQLSVLNAQYGRLAGDQALFVAGTHLQSELCQFGSLFRWTGPAFVCVVDNPESDLRDFDRRAKQVVSTAAEWEIQIDQQTADFQIVFRWAIHEVQSKDTTESVRRKLDALSAA